MQQKQRSSIVISALLTTLVMVLTAGGLLAYNGLLPLPNVSAQSATVQTVPEEAPIVVTVQPVLVPAQQQAVQTTPVQAVADQAASVWSAPAQAAQAAPAANDAALAAYEAQLKEAYAALQEAYTQIDVLQTAQAQPAAIAVHREDDDHESSHQGEKHEGGEREHDDD